MNIRLLAFDLDKTLLNGNSAIPLSTRTTLRELINQGIHVVIATGRPWWRTKEVIGDLPIHAAVCGNGTIIVDPRTERVLSIRRFEAPVIRQLVQFGRSRGLFTIFTYYRPDDEIQKFTCHEGTPTTRVASVLSQLKLVSSQIPDLLGHEYLASRLAYIPELKDTASIASKVTSRFQGHPVYPYHHIQEPVVEILPIGCNKASGIALVAKTLGVPCSQVMAFGDDHNDTEMLAWAGVSIAMNHAPIEIRDLCTNSIPWQDGEGVNTYLRTVFRL